MKTTIDIAPSLLDAAKLRAGREGRTLRELLEEALRAYLEVARHTRGRFRLKSGAYRGRGLQPGVAEGRWEEIRNLIYPLSS